LLACGDTKELKLLVLRRQLADCSGDPGPRLRPEARWPGAAGRGQPDAAHAGGRGRRLR